MNQLFRYYAGFIWIFVDSSIPLKMCEIFLEKASNLSHKYFTIS